MTPLDLIAKRLEECEKATPENLITAAHVQQEALQWAWEMFVARDEMNSKVHCAPVRLSEITIRVQQALHTGALALAPKNIPASTQLPAALKALAVAVEALESYAAATAHRVTFKANGDAEVDFTTLAKEVLPKVSELMGVGKNE